MVDDLTIKEYPQQIQQCIDYFKLKIFDHFPEDLTAWVAGGAVASYFRRGYANHDIDVWFPNEHNRDWAIECFKAIDGAVIIRESDSATTLKVDNTIIQCIKRYYFDTPMDTINQFDFTVCCGAVNRTDFFHHPTFFIDLTSRRIVINKLTFPLDSLRRLQKYIKGGFSACNGSLLELARALQSVDLENVNQNVLEFYPDGTPRFMRFD